MKLNYYYRIYIPSTIGAKHINNAKQVKEVCKLFGNLFGGYTVTTNRGGWVMNTGDLCEEETVTITSFCDKMQFKKHSKTVKQIALHLKEEMKQEAISLEIMAKKFKVSRISLHII